MKSATYHSLLLAISAILLSAIAVRVCGLMGHEIVGAIADERLTNTAAPVKSNALIGGITF